MVLALVVAVAFTVALPAILRRIDRLGRFSAMLGALAAVTVLWVVVMIEVTVMALT